MTFVLTWLTLCLAATTAKTYRDIVLAAAGVVLSAVYGSKNMHLSSQYQNNLKSRGLVWLSGNTKGVGEEGRRILCHSEEESSLVLWEIHLRGVDRDGA